MQDIVDLILEVGPPPWCACSCCTRLGANVRVVLQEDFDSEQMSALSSCLAELFKDHFRGDLLPEEITEE